MLVSKAGKTMAKKRTRERNIAAVQRQLTGKSTTTPSYQISQASKDESIVRRYKLPTSTLTKQVSGDKDEMRYLRRDLLKILILAAVAFGFQIALFVALQNHLIRLPF